MRSIGRDANPGKTMDRFKSRLQWKSLPEVEPLEGRLLLSASGPAQRVPIRGVDVAPAVHPVRPNTPVLPFGAATNVATFLDPTTRIVDGQRTVLGQRSFVGPYATLDARGGSIRIGSGSAVLDNATVSPAAGGSKGASAALGDFVLIGYNATVRGASVVGAFGESLARPTGVGPGALIDGAVIAPGAVVGALARVGPGVTVPSGVFVLPGANVTTDAEASSPTLGKVVPVPADVAGAVSLQLTRASELAAGYTVLYQGQANTGANLGVDSRTSPGVFNGNLAVVSGAGLQPGPSTATGINFEPARSGPKFPSAHRGLAEGLLPNFRARVTGDARFLGRAATVAHNLGRGNAFRADQGQPVTFASAPSTGNAVTINSPLGGAVTTGGVTRTVGSITVGLNLRAETGAVLLGGPGATYPVGDDVTIGAGAVVERSALGSGAVIGARSYVSGSTVAPGQVVPPGTILVNDVVVRQVEW